MSDYHVSPDVNISFKRTPAAAATAAIANNPDDPNAIHVNLIQEDIREQYPWDYANLTTRLENRYIDFKANPKYHGIRKRLATSPQFKRTGLLDLANPAGLKKDYCRPNIVKEFDKHYTLRR